MADRDSAFYLSALDSFAILSAATNITEVVLTFHEDCFYFTDKYGASPAGPTDDIRRKWQLVDEAMANVSGWSDNLQVRPLYLSLPHSHSHQGSTAAAATERPAPSAVRPAPQAPAPRIAPGPKTVPGLPNERATMRAFDHQLEERLLHTNESAEDVIALAEGQARETGSLPTWRIERRALEFISALRTQGGRNPQEIRQLVRAFVINYAGDDLPRSVMRALLTELDRELQLQR